MSQQAQVTFKDYPENVRKRKEMYLPNIDYMLYEIIDNAVDEASAGNCNTIAITVFDNVVKISDDGSGIPITIPKDDKTRNKFPGLSQAEIAFTTLHAGGKFGDKNGYQTATGGLHGVGASCVNALSENMKLSSYSKGKKHSVLFSRGIITEKLHLENDSVDRTGTDVTFVADPKIWGNEKYDLVKINKRLKQLAYLNAGVVFYVHFEAEDKSGISVKIKEEYCFEDGIKAYMEEKLKYKKILSPILNKTVTINDEELGTIELSLATTYTDTYSSDINSFVNNISTENGGDHEAGFKMGINEAIKQYIFNNNKNIIFEASDVREGLTSIISLKVKEPRFEGQSKSKINMPKIKTITKGIVHELFYNFLDHNPNEATIILNKIENAAKARLAAKKARDNIRKSKNLIDSGLPGKLADCSEKNPELCEVYIVEGDSAGGSAKQARNRKTQAILPIFGKVLNTERAKLNDVVNNEKLKDLLKAIKTGIGPEFDIERLRYHKIILMSDADVDGEHIMTLYLTFFYRYLRPLIEEGHLYLACPPLYKVSKGKKVDYLYSDKELEAYDKEGISIQRYKGLGEMNPNQLWDTTMNPDTRKIIQINIEDVDLAEEMLVTCMGEKVEPRRKFIEENALYAKIDA